MPLLTFGAHPDDIEFGISPLLIKESKKGTKNHMVICSLGESGTNGSPEIRKQESQKSSDLIQATLQFLDLGGDGHITYSTPNIIKIAQTIRDIKPQIILAPTTSKNQHPDHYHLGDMVRDACRIARYGGFKELINTPAHSIKNLFYYSITSFENTPPDIIIDISNEYDQWMQVMKCHQSQLQTKNYIQLQTEKTKLLGMKTNSQYAIGLYKNEALKINSISEITESSRLF